MTKNELQRQLDRLGINNKFYSLDGGVHDDKYVLSQEPMGKWSVYYSERGLIIDKRVFNNESDACELLLNKLLREPTLNKKSRID